MKTLVILCNIVMFCFTCMVLVTDGMAKEAAYIVFTLLLLLIPLLTVFVFAGGGGASSRALQRAALIGNVVLLAAICWAFADQYPHPQEEGFVAYMVVIVLTPILSAVVLFLGIRRKAPEALKAPAQP